MWALDYCCTRPIALMPSSLPWAYHAGVPTVVAYHAGVPTVVAKRMIQNGGLIGRIVLSAQAAATAAADGASLVLVTVSSVSI